MREKFCHPQNRVQLSPSVDPNAAIVAKAEYRIHAVAAPTMRAVLEGTHPKGADFAR